MGVLASTYRPDPAGVFATDAHRHVLGHLPLPSDPYGYTPAALHDRLGVLESIDHLHQLLAELAHDGLVEHDSATDAYRQSQAGHEGLTGPIADEPPEGAEVQGPALLALGPPVVALRPKIERGPGAAVPFGSSDAQK